MKNITALILFTFSFSALAYFEIKDVASFSEECTNNKEFTNPNYKIECGRHFHHYNSSASVRSSSRRRNIKISHFNALHPGMSKTRFKDYDLVAKMLSQFDIIAVTELIPSMAASLQTNIRVADFARSAPREIRVREAEIATLTREQRSKHSVTRERRINLQKQIVANIKNDLKKLNRVYKAPGYLKILNSLRALNDGNNWSLIISSTPEGRESNDTKELVGYYYKANIIKPTNTPYCLDRNLKNGSKAYACHPLFDRRDLGSDKSFILSRRPFMASFKAQNFHTTLISSHSLYESPKLGNAWRSRVLRAAFNKISTKDLPTGINEGNYVRFAELKVTLEFIQKKLRTSNKDIVMLGDYNLESKNQFMDEVIKTWNGARLFIDKKTSVKEFRYEKDGRTPTNGVSSNYDHFILDPRKTSECMRSANSLDGDVYNFLNQPSHLDFIAKKYKVRLESRFRSGKYSIDRQKYQKLIQQFVEPIKSLKKPIYTIGRKKFTYQGKHSLTGPAIVYDRNEMEEQTSHFASRILDSQRSNDSYYGFYKQLISDHLPIYMSCSIN